MTQFIWYGRNPRGEEVEGELEAPTKDSASRQLVALGIVPIDLAEKKLVSAASAGEFMQSLMRKPVTSDDLILFTRQLHTLNKAGVPILRALAGLESSSESEALVTMIKDMRSSLDQGRSLSDAVARHEQVFGRFYVSMIRVGEMTGQLSEVLVRLGDYIKFEKNVRARIKQSLRYPSFVITAMMIAIGLVNLLVIPVFAKVFDKFHSQLPLVTRILIGTSNFATTWWPVVLAMGAGAFLSARAYLKTDTGRYWWDSKKLRLPIVGSIILKSTLARFARSFALASKSGVPVVQSLTVVAQTVDNAFIGRRIEQMREGIERGESISRCAAAAGIFTPVVMQMINVGEESGELDALLFEVAEMYEQDTSIAIEGLSSAIEPILLTFVGVLVLIMALGVFLPMWDMGRAAMGGGGG